MRIGMNVPFRDGKRELLDGAGVAARAQMIEAAGLDGIWIGDHLSPTRPDPLLWLLTAANATEHVEIGTAIYIVPLRRPHDLAQRFVTLQTLAPGRFTIGVGTGSLMREFEMVGVNFDDRFRLLHEAMGLIRSICDGDWPDTQISDAARSQRFLGVSNAAGTSRPAPWGKTVGRPRFVLGAWHSEAQMRKAVADYDGWMCSAGRTTYKTMTDAIKRYRDLGGRRALIATCSVDLRAPTTPLGPDDPFHLECQPQVAEERLHRVAELGFDDILLAKTDVEHRFGGGFEHDFTAEELEEIRSLLPKDPRPVT
ncbi:MAG: LLM class flavin-dependent oxidoreductase [Acidimicrobiales bacterium]|nr:LLM class flavin-dependent oxidoreductase [Acidimicrobiales bacterium]